MSKIAKLSFTVSILGLLLSGNVALGGGPNLSAGDASMADTGISFVGPTNVSGLVDVIRNVVKWVYVIFFIIAVLFILFAAFTYLTAGGDSGKVEKAKNQIIYAAVAIAVALLAVGVELIVKDLLKTS